MMKEIARPYERKLEIQADGEGISLPESFEGELVSERAESPLSRMLSYFNRAGVSHDELRRYRLAVHEFLRRDSTVKTGEIFDFRPQERYFAPHLQYIQNVPSFDFLPKKLKPHFGKEKSIATTRFEDGRGILNTLEKGIERNKENITPFERTLTRLNRFMYSLHEPLHILQGFVSGDQLNIIKERLGIKDDEFDKEKEQEYIKYVSLTSGEDVPVKKPTWVEESIVTSKLNIPTKPSGYWTELTVESNEAVMDALQDFSVQETIRQHPEIVLWAHNTICVSFEALRILRDDLRTRLAAVELEDQVMPQAKKNALAILEQTIGFVERIYFAAFDNARMGMEYLRDQNHAPSGKKFTGLVVETDAFDRLDVLNTLMDVKKLSELLPQYSDRGGIEKSMSVWPGEYTFPSGKTHIREILRINVEPITSEGIAGALRFIRGLIARGHGSKELEEELGRIDDIIDNVLDVSQNQEPLQRQVLRMEKLSGVSFTVNDLREMHGTARHVFADTLDESYPFTAEFRKRFMREFYDDAPEQVDVLIRPLFFEIPFQRKIFLRLSGFGIFNKKEMKIKPWDQITTERQLGILNIDVNGLDEDDKTVLHTLYQQYAASENAPKGVDIYSVMEKLVIMRRKYAARNEHE